MDPSFDDEKSLFDFVVRDGNGIKGLVDLGLLTVPDQYVQPLNKRIDKSCVFPYDQRPIDLSSLDGPNHSQVVEAIVRAAETFGFFQVVNHGVPLELLDSLKDSAHEFFRLPPEKKAVYLKEVSPSPLVKYGTSFVPEKEKALEWKDHISMMYTNDDDASKYWPNECKQEALEYLKTSTKLVRKILEVLIGQLGVTVDQSRINAFMATRMVNMNFYPKCPNPDLTLGVGRHSDMGTLTVLLQDGIGGLYVRVEEEGEEAGKQEKWMEILPVPGALVVNVGDALQILSNGKYKSAEHRVCTSNSQSRVSIPTFATPRLIERIGPLSELVERDGVARYREFIFVDYMNNFFGKAHEGKKSLDFALINSVI